MDGNGWKVDSFREFTWSLFKVTWFVVMGVDRIRFLSLQTYTVFLFKTEQLLIMSLHVHFFFWTPDGVCLFTVCILPTQQRKSPSWTPPTNVKDKLDKASPSHRHGSDFSEIMDAAKGAIGKARTHGGWLGPWWDWDAGNFGELKKWSEIFDSVGG